VTDEKNAHMTADSTAGEKLYSDPYGLYRRWLGASEDVQDEANEGKVSSTELGELWRRWFEATAGLRSEASEADNGFMDHMAPLWKEMADDVSAKMLSGESLPEDPVRFFVQWYNETEERWSETADELLRRDENLESMGRFFETYARSEAELRHASEEGLKNSRVPTRSDVARVAKLVVVVENKVDRIEEALEELAHGDSVPAMAAGAAVTGLEERMDRLEGKMDRILAALGKLVGDDQDLPETPQSSSERKEYANKSVTPLEGLSLELIEAGYVGAGGWGVLEGPKAKDED
jgi:polyhydroxyalkanoic acid synthase PhaR subunit